jgi:hypothetical protein
MDSDYYHIWTHNPRFYSLQDYAVALKWTMDNFMCTNEAGSITIIDAMRAPSYKARVGRQGETYWAASDIGWVVGHSYIVYGPLLQGCSTVVFEGKPVGTPDAGCYWRVCEVIRPILSCFLSPAASSFVFASRACCNAIPVPFLYHSEGVRGESHVRRSHRAPGDAAGRPYWR